MACFELKTILASLNFMLIEIETNEAISYFSGINFMSTQDYQVTNQENILQNKFK